MLAGMGVAVATLALAVAGSLGPASGEPPAQSGDEAAWSADSKMTDHRGRWKEIAKAPFGSTDVEAIWTGDEIILFERESRRVASYDPTADAWTRRAKMPERYDSDVFGPAVWTGSEVIIPGLLQSSSGPNVLGGYRFDPGPGSWAQVAESDVASDAEASDQSDTKGTGVDAAAWDGSRVLAVTSDHEVAGYDPASDSWKHLRGIDDDGYVWRVYVGDMGPFVETRDADGITLHSYDAETEAWTTEPASPLDPDAVREGAFWFGDRLAYVTFHPGGLDQGAADAWFDPATAEWTTFRHGCGGTWLKNDGATPAGSFLVDGAGRRMLDMEPGRCHRLPRQSPRFLGGQLVWTGEQLIYWSGVKDDSSAPTRRGLSLSVD